MKLFINNNCRFVKGFKNAAIYDFNNNKVFSINETGKNIIIKALKRSRFIKRRTGLHK